MGKKLVLLAAVLLTLSLTACGEKCSVEGCNKKLYEDGYCEYHYAQFCKDAECDDEVYKDGYCKYHYTVNSVDNTAKDLFDGFFGS